MQKGCACKFLHGPGTDQEKLVEIEKALEAKTELQVEVQFYRKNGTIRSIVIVSLLPAFLVSLMILCSSDNLMHAQSQNRFIHPLQNISVR